MMPLPGQVAWVFFFECGLGLGEVRDSLDYSRSRPKGRPPGSHAKPGPAFVRTTSSVLSPDAFDQSCAVTRTDPRTSPSLEPHYPRVHCPARMPDRIVLAGCQPHHRPPKLDTTSARERGDHRQWIAPRLTGLQDGPAADEKLPRQRHDRLFLGQAVGEQTTPEGQRPAVVT